MLCTYFPVHAANYYICGEQWPSEVLSGWCALHFIQCRCLLWCEKISQKSSEWLEIKIENDMTKLNGLIYYLNIYIGIPSVFNLG